MLQNLHSDLSLLPSKTSVTRSPPHTYKCVYIYIYLYINIYEYTPLVAQYATVIGSKADMLVKDSNQKVRL
jgi:hypothetical protein